MRIIAYDSMLTSLYLIWVIEIQWRHTIYTKNEKKVHNILVSTILFSDNKKKQPSVNYLSAVHNSGPMDIFVCFYLAFHAKNTVLSKSFFIILWCF